MSFITHEMSVIGRMWY